MSQAGTAKRAAGAIEFAVGMLVLAGLAGLLALALLGTGRKAPSGYLLTARFPHIDGLGIGSDVKLAGVTIGQVMSERVDPKSYQAVVSFTVGDAIRLPTDSSAVITSDSLLGGKYLALAPGGADAVLKPGEQSGLTQGSISLEQLLSKFIFSVTDAVSKKPGATMPASGPAPGPGPGPGPGQTPTPTPAPGPSP